MTSLISFRGEDTRDSFSSYLYEALCDANIQTVMDHKLHKGEHFSPILLKTIEESEISLIIFSKHYASSTWCMDELVHIMKCRDKYQRFVIPIFYDVDASNVRKQNARFGDGFVELKQRFKHNQEKVQEWTNALIQSANLSGWDSKNFRPESELVKKIVKDVLSKLKRKSSIHMEGLVGINHQIQKVEELVSEARTVGIWGMGGIGKTTLARAVFDRLKPEFEALCFAKDVKQQLAERNGLDELLKKSLKELLKDDDINAYDLRSASVRTRLQRKKILLVLDDVDNFITAEDLIKACNWFGEGSRIIITSRDMQVLKNTSASASPATYQVPELDPHHSLHLFSLNAFKQNQPFENYLELSKRVVDYCKGNPLALKVLGGYLHDRGKEVWENIDMSELKDRSLIFVSGCGNIQMHALLTNMGLEISKQQLKSDPENPIRLSGHENIYRYFSNNDKGIEAIRCMSLDASKIESITLTASHFRKMHYLMSLKVYKSDRGKRSKLNICEDLDYLSKELRFLSWEGYPLPSVPLQFCAKNLIKLNLPKSNIQQLWNGYQQFPNLEEISLWDSKNLRALPDLSQAPKIERIILRGCVNLGQIHSSTVPEKDINLFIKDCGPMQINVGGSMHERSSSRLVIVHNSLDLADLTFNKVTMKVMLYGKMICGVGFKHVRMPLKEMAEFMRMGIQSLATLLPFVRRVKWLESPIEFGHDFKQHYTYDVNHYYNGNTYFSIAVWVRSDGEERGVEDDEEEDEDEREMISENEREMNSKGDQVVETELLLMEDEQEEDDDENDSKSATTLIITTLILNTIPCWSLLVRVTLKESDIIIGNNASCSSIPQVSIILKSLNEDCRRRIQPLLVVQLSSPISPLRHHSFGVFYNYLERMPHDPCFLCFRSKYLSNNHFDDHDLVVYYAEHY
ncbi:TMV resistance protein N-like [Neltuma alba]|uniref:TMV resistance protein N-like n=1 Tax=Neltuma alba TaxID=207710 RepID=UPI0010A5425B|nr:TMV resistance protein N-like [Prosopis alba]